MVVGVGMVVVNHVYCCCVVLLFCCVALFFYLYFFVYFLGFLCTEHGKLESSMGLLW